MLDASQQQKIHLIPYTSLAIFMFCIQLLWPQHISMLEIPPDSVTHTLSFTCSVTIRIVTCSSFINLSNHMTIQHRLFAIDMKLTCKCFFGIHCPIFQEIFRRLFSKYGKVRWVFFHKKPNSGPPPETQYPLISPIPPVTVSKRP